MGQILNIFLSVPETLEQEWEWEQRAREQREHEERRRQEELVAIRLNREQPFAAGLANNPLEFHVIYNNSNKCHMCDTVVGVTHNSNVWIELFPMPSP